MGASMVRELVRTFYSSLRSASLTFRFPSLQHVYGTAIGVHGRNPKKFQHQVRPPRFASIRCRASSDSPICVVIRVSGRS